MNSKTLIILLIIIGIIPTENSQSENELQGPEELKVELKKLLKSEKELIDPYHQKCFKTKNNFCKCCIDSSRNLTKINIIPILSV